MMHMHVHRTRGMNSGGHIDGIRSERQTAKKSAHFDVPSCAYFYRRLASSFRR